MQKPLFNLTRPITCIYAISSNHADLPRCILVQLCHPSPEAITIYLNILVQLCHQLVQIQDRVAQAYLHVPMDTQLARQNTLEVNAWFPVPPMPSCMCEMHDACN